MRVKYSEGRFVWFRDSELPAFSENVTKRELFSVCGKLTRHYSTAGWLRIACSFIKRTANGVIWDQEIPGYIEEMIGQVLVRVAREDLVKGVWELSIGRSSVVWCDASSLSVGCCL